MADLRGSGEADGDGQVSDINPHDAVDFRPIPGWPEYEINKTGDVRRVKPAYGTRPGKPLTWHYMENGYAKVSLCRNAKRKEFLVHRLVALTFIGDPDGMDVCHFDGDKLNNHVSNLRIDTRAGNMADSIRLGRTPRGERCGSNKYPERLVIELRDRLDKGEKVSAISRETGIPKPTLYGIRSRQNWWWL